MMKFFKGLITTTKSLGEKFENYSLLIDKVWLLINSEDTEKTTYIFRSKNDELLISNNGIVTKGKWEYIKTSNCLLLDLDGASRLYQVLYARDNYLIFQNDFSVGEYVFVNESYYRNKYAKLGGKMLDHVLHDIGKKESNVENNVPGPIKIEIVEKTVDKKNDRPVFIEPAERTRLDDNIDKIDGIIEKLRKSTNK